MKKAIDMPPTMILCGGRGTRLGDMTKITPKPMVKIGNDPIVWHIMHWYAAFGCRRFILCLGYLKDVFHDYFKRRARTIERLGWEIELVDTGVETGTGGRVWRAAKVLRPEDGTFFLTYGDCLGSIDIVRLLRKHRMAKRMITLTAVHPASRFGELVIKGDRVTDFSEKGISRYYINGGFMAIDRAFLGTYLTKSPRQFFEQGPMRNAAAAGQMTVFKHEGFWQCMDTPREHELLKTLLKSGHAPWIPADEQTPSRCNRSV